MVLFCIECFSATPPGYHGRSRSDHLRPALVRLHHPPRAPLQRKVVVPVAGSLRWEVVRVPRGCRCSPPHRNERRAFPCYLDSTKPRFGTLEAALFGKGVELEIGGAGQGIAA